MVRATPGPATAYCARDPLGRAAPAAAAAMPPSPAAPMILAARVSRRGSTSLAAADSPTAAVHSSSTAPNPVPTTDLDGEADHPGEQQRQGRGRGDRHSHHPLRHPRAALQAVVDRLMADIRLPDEASLPEPDRRRPGYGR